MNHDNNERWAEYDTMVADYLGAMTDAKTAERTLKARFAALFMAFKNAKHGVEDAKQMVMTDNGYLDAWMQADTAAINEKAAKLRLDKFEMQLDVWRTKESTKRAAMTLR